MLTNSYAVARHLYTILSFFVLHVFHFWIKNKFNLFLQVKSSYWCYELRLTLRVRDSAWSPYATAVVAIWLLSLNTVANKFTSEDFPDLILPITNRLISLHWPGGSNARIFSKSWSFVLKNRIASTY